MPGQLASMQGDDARTDTQCYHCILGCEHCIVGKCNQIDCITQRLPAASLASDASTINTPGTSRASSPTESARLVSTLTSAISTMDIALQDEVELQRVLRQNMHEKITVRHERIERFEIQIEDIRKVIWREEQAKNKSVAERDRIDAKIEALRALQETIQSPEVTDLAK